MNSMCISSVRRSRFIEMLIISLVLTFNLQISLGCEPFSFVSADGSGSNLLNMSASPNEDNNIEISIDTLNVSGDINITGGSDGKYMQKYSVLDDSNITFSGISKGAVYTISHKNSSTTFEILRCQIDCCIICTPILLELISVKHISENTYIIRYVIDTSSNFTPRGMSYAEDGTGREIAITRFRIEDTFLEANITLKNDTDYLLKFFYGDLKNPEPECDNSSSIAFHVPRHPREGEEYFRSTKIQSDRIDDMITTREYVFIAVILVILSMLFLFLWRNVPKFKKIVQSKETDIDKVSVKSKLSFSGVSRASTCSGRQEINPLYTKLEEMEKELLDPYEFPRSRLELKTKIGGGEFGEVYYSKAHGLHDMPGYILVAVKKLKDNPPYEEVTDFLAEISMLKRIGRHSNIVQLLACVTRSEPYMAIMELVLNGDLREYLLNIRNKWETKDFNVFFMNDCDGVYIEPPAKLDLMKDVILKERTNNGYLPTDVFEECARDNPTIEQPMTDDVMTPLVEDLSIPPEPALDNKELENFALQIARGMAYLENIGIVHRDLAARNILITRRKTLKITDFGMSRPGPYVNRNFRKIPLRWVAPEAILQMKTNNKTDVWAFAVVLWEIGTLGAYPYNGIENEYILPYLQSGKRLNKPETCTNDHYDLMLSCWSTAPDNRPSFGEIVNRLSISKHEAYVDFSQINPKYVFPPPDPSRNDLFDNLKVLC